MKKADKAYGILLLKSGNENLEIDFELDFLRSLTPRQRFLLMERKRRETRALLRRHGHGTASSITKRP
jgi:hypothetical protein